MRLSCQYRQIKRGDGTTSRQMLGAPVGAVFVGASSDLLYAKELARHLGRGDLRIVSPSWLEHSWRGVSLKGLVVDHAAELTESQTAGLIGVLGRA